MDFGNLNYDLGNPFADNGSWGSFSANDIPWQNANTEWAPNENYGGQIPEYRDVHLARILAPHFQQMGFQGPAVEARYGEGDTGKEGDFVTQGFQDWLSQNGYSLRGATGNSDRTLAGVFDRNGQMLRAADAPDADKGILGQWATMMAPAIGGVVGINPAGFVGQTLQGAAQGGATSATMGGDFTKGAITGGAGAGLNSLVSGFNPAAWMGVDNAAYQKPINSGITSAFKALLTGGNPLQSGFTSALTTGLNQVGGSLFGTAPVEQPYSSNPAMNASYPMGSVPDDVRITQMLTGQSFDQPQPEMSYAQDPMANLFSNASLSRESTQPTERASSNGGLLGDFSLPQGLQGALNWAGNNLGDVAGGLYSMYTQRKNMKGLKSQMAGLQGLYDSNGAYAKQLRRTLERKDAQSGRRSDYAGRETQLMAALANGAAQTAPGLFQMQNAQNQMRTNQMMQMMKFGQASGLFNSLGNMFRTQAPDPNVFTGGLFGNGAVTPRMPDWANLSLGTGG